MVLADFFNFKIMLARGIFEREISHTIGADLRDLCDLANLRRLANMFVVMFALVNAAYSITLINWYILLYYLSKYGYGSSVTNY